MALELSDRLARIPPYPAAESYGAGENLALLASNESPDPPLPAVRQAGAAALDRANRYPDPANARLRSALSDHCGVDRESIAVGNGSSDLLLALGQVLLNPAAEVIYSWPPFALYRHVAAASGARASEVPLDSAQRHDLQAMARAVTPATRLLIVCNPNNPTSTAVEGGELASFVAALPREVCVVVDEAYCEYSALHDRAQARALLSSYDNLVLLRTFSKIYSLCGMRVGYGLCGSPELRAAIDRVRQPFSVTTAGQAAALEALNYPDEIAARAERNLARRSELEDGVEELGLVTAQSQTNFIWLGLGAERDESAIVAGLAEDGVIVRAGTGLGKTGWVRVTVGSDADNRRFLTALGPLL